MLNYFKKFKKVKILTALFILFILSACTNDIDFVEDEPFVKLTPYLAAEGTIVDHFPKNITVSDNGEVVVFTEDVLDRRGEEVELDAGENPPTIEKEISSEEVKELQDLIKKNKFFSIPEDITDYDVMDGGGSRITVYTTDGERTVGGENTDHEGYLEIRNYIYDLVKDEYSDWVEETEEYLIELNNLDE